MTNLPLPGKPKVFVSVRVFNVVVFLGFSALMGFLFATCLD